ncbi:hypothetical protein acsn021_22590 [Anaerocolumna cellulosilytica]|uniref:Uncharacterized protein n=1 Tax=Anaerocolumna cellulosilytica TaxID=433286 RepID=A0A6S6R5J0_9FIRM|nr:oligosaccharide flippase family protein [Anaerocolumna cellulosilytica]MBB5194094.1 O-antigen/teichoic acid export membrane protein [Anaerocolumna cellulosilytica]BCJ94690.1 hypothetical protein acsn021_22590 [Anaerocolumna cellulosilytica]
MNESGEQYSSKQIKLGAIMAYISIAVNIVAGLIYTPWMVRSIGQGDYGLYTLSVSLISMFVLDFGLGAAVTRFLSKYNSDNDQESINNLLGIVSKLFFVLDIIISVVLVIVYFLIGSIYQQLTFEEIIKLKVIYVITASFSVISFPFTTLNGILTSYEKFIYQKGCDLLNRMLNMALIILALSMGYGLYTLVTINAITGGINILIKLGIVRKITPVKIHLKHKSRKMLKEILGFSIWSMIITIAQRLIFNIIPTILGAFSGSISIAVFGAASTLEGFVYTFSTGINDLFLPKVSRIVLKDDNQSLLTLMIKVGRVQFVVIGLLFTGFFTIGRDFINLWLGGGFESAYLCTLFLMLPSLIELPQHIAGLAVIAVNKVRSKSFIFILTSLLNVVLSIFLTRQIGVLGAAVSISAAYLLRTAAMNVLYYKQLNLNIFTFFKECHVKMSLAFILSILTGFLLPNLITVNGWLTLGIKGLLITAVYIVFMWFLALNTYEKNLFFSAGRKLIKKILKN